MPTLSELKQQLKTFKDSLPEGFTSFDELDRANDLWLQIKKAEYRQRKGYKKSLRGFYKSPEFRTFKKSATQRSRRFKTKLLESGDVKQLPVLDQEQAIPFWIALYPSPNGGANQMLYTYLPQYDDFTVLYREIQTDQDGIFVTYDRRENTVVGLYKLLANRYRHFNEMKMNQKKKKKGFGTLIFPTDLTAYKLDNLLVLDIEVDTDEEKQLQ